MNPIHEQQIDQRIEDLFPIENFYFYKIFDERHGDKEYVKKRNEKELEELLKLIQDNMASKRYYIKEGLLEPVQISEEERDLIIEGMLASIGKIFEEVNKSKDICLDITGNVNPMLKERLEETVEFFKKFNDLLTDKPYTLQKCSLQGIVLAKEIISKARDEANE